MVITDEDPEAKQTARSNLAVVPKELVVVVLLLLPVALGIGVASEWLYPGGAVADSSGAAMTLARHR